MPFDELVRSQYINDPAVRKPGTITKEDSGKKFELKKDSIKASSVSKFMMFFSILTVIVIIVSIALLITFGVNLYVNG